MPQRTKGSTESLKNRIPSKPLFMAHPTNLAASFGVNSLGVELKILHFQSSSMTKC